MLDLATGAPEFARTVTQARQVEASSHRWEREYDELKAHDARRKKGPARRLFGPSEVEKRRAFLEHALDAAHEEGITIDEWVRAQKTDPALSERAEWAGLNSDDAVLAMDSRRRRRAA